MFSIYDSKAKSYLPPFHMPNDDMALRVFQDCVSDPNHAFGKHPEDYTLFHLGSFDDETGIIFCELVEAIANGITLVNPAAAEETPNRQLVDVQEEQIIPKKTDELEEPDLSNHSEKPDHRNT